MTTSEEWRSVVGDPDYEVSSLGRVRSRRRGWLVVLSPATDAAGYLRVGLERLNNDGRRRRANRTVHSLVAEAFIGPRPEGKEVRHVDGNPANNNVANLTYATHAENIRDKRRHGTDANLNKTHCPLGHPYAGANLIVRRNGSRACRACRLRWR